MSRFPRSPVLMSYSRFEYRVADSAIAATASGGERSATEIGVQDHAGCIDDATKRGSELKFDDVRDALLNGGEIGRGMAPRGVGFQFCPQVGHGVPRRLCDDSTSGGFHQCNQCRSAKQFVNRRERAQAIARTV